MLHIALDIIPYELSCGHQQVFLSCKLDQTNTSRQVQAVAHMTNGE
jgi:hypothetical protein